MCVPIPREEGGGGASPICWSSGGRKGGPKFMGKCRLPRREEEEGEDKEEKTRGGGEGGPWKE